MKQQQQDLIESAGRNLAERIKAIKEDGDGYMTVVTAEETESVIAKMKQDAKRYSNRYGINGANIRYACTRYSINMLRYSNPPALEIVRLGES